MLLSDCLIKFQFVQQPLTGSGENSGVWIEMMRNWYQNELTSSVVVSFRLLKRDSLSVITLLSRAIDNTGNSFSSPKVFVSFAYLVYRTFYLTIFRPWIGKHISNVLVSGLGMENKWYLPFKFCNAIEIHFCIIGKGEEMTLSDGIHISKDSYLLSRDVLTSLLAMSKLVELSSFHFWMQLWRWTQHSFTLWQTTWSEETPAPFILLWRPLP